MDSWFLTFWIVLNIMISVYAAGHALLKKSDPRSALGWVVISFALPFIGPLLYWSFGINRISLTAMRWKESRRRLSAGEFCPLPTGNEAKDLPSSSAHLKDLKFLSDQVVNSRLLRGNAIRALVNGEETYPAMLRAIGEAETSIHLCTYIFDTDTSGKEVAAALVEAVGRGVEVRIIIDSLGEKYSFPRVRKLFHGTGVKVARFLPLRQGWYINLRTHRKILLIDGRIGFTGGMNIGDRHVVSRAKKPVKDIHFQVEGPVVGDLQRVFLEDWYFAEEEFLDDQRYFPQPRLAGDAMARAVADGPDRQFRKLHWIIMGALSRARRRVIIMTPYFIPDRSLVTSLISTSLRGVEVTLILPGTNNLPYVHWATRAYLPELLYHGIRIFYQPPPFVHSKIFLVDDVYALIGSANLDPRSLRLNFELNLEVFDENLAAELTAYCREALAQSREVTHQEMESLPLPVRLIDGFVRLFSPYL